MEESNTYIEKIHRFLTNKMDDTEAAEFRKEVAANEQLKQDLALEKKLLSSITGVGDRILKGNIAAVDKKLLAEGFFKDASSNEKKERKLVRFSFRSMLAIAAGLALAVGAAWWAISNSTPKSNAEIFAQYCQPERTEINRQIDKLTSHGMIGTQSEEERLRKALQIYREGKFEEASSALELILKDRPKNRTARFYYAVALLHLEKIPAAFTILRELSVAPDFELREEAEWYRALSLLRLPNNEQAAIDLFKKIASSDSKFKNKARDVLSVFERREQKI